MYYKNYKIRLLSILIRYIKLIVDRKKNIYITKQPLCIHTPKRKTWKFFFLCKCEIIFQ